jgi:hypothetical protein
MTFTEMMEHVATGVELLGVGVLVVGIAWSGVRAAVGCHLSPPSPDWSTRSAWGGSRIPNPPVRAAWSSADERDP